MNEWPSLGPRSGWQTNSPRAFELVTSLAAGWVELDQDLLAVLALSPTFRTPSESSYKQDLIRKENGSLGRRSLVRMTPLRCGCKRRKKIRSFCWTFLGLPVAPVAGSGQKRSELADFSGAGFFAYRRQSLPPASEKPFPNAPKARGAFPSGSQGLSQSSLMMLEEAKWALTLGTRYAGPFPPYHTMRFG